MVFPGFSPGEQSPINRGTATKPPGCWHSWQRTVCTTKKWEKLTKKAKRKWKKIENKSEEAPRVLTPLTTQCFVPIKIPSTNQYHLCLLLHTSFPMILVIACVLKKVWWKPSEHSAYLKCLKVSDRIKSCGRTFWKLCTPSTHGKLANRCKNLKENNFFP